MSEAKFNVDEEGRVTIEAKFVSDTTFKTGDALIIQFTEEEAINVGLVALLQAAIVRNRRR